MLSENWEFRERNFLVLYRRFSSVVLFFSYAPLSVKFFGDKIFKTKFSGAKFLEKKNYSCRENFFVLLSFRKKFLFRKKSARSKVVLWKNALLFGYETLPSLVVIEDTDLRDAAEWGALNRKSRLLRFARIRNLLRGGMNRCIIKV